MSLPRSWLLGSFLLALPLAAVLPAADPPVADPDEVLLKGQNIARAGRRRRLPEVANSRRRAAQGNRGADRPTQRRPLRQPRSRFPQTDGTRHGRGSLSPRSRTQSRGQGPQPRRSVSGTADVGAGIVGAGSRRPLSEPARRRGDAQTVPRLLPQRGPGDRRGRRVGRPRRADLPRRQGGRELARSGQGRRAERRSAAAYVLGRVGGAEQRALVRTLLGDGDARVRRYAAYGLLNDLCPRKLDEKAVQVTEKVVTDAKLAADAPDAGPVFSQTHPARRRSATAQASDPGARQRGLPRTRGSEYAAGRI